MLCKGYKNKFSGEKYKPEVKKNKKKEKTSGFNFIY